METDESGTHKKKTKGDKQDNISAAIDVLRKYAESDRGTDAPPTAEEEAIVLKKWAEENNMLIPIEQLIGPQFETVPCTLTYYREIVKALPRPTPVQIDNFVKYVSEAHSWYKHLPLLPPGETFQFFIDPFSGFNRVIQPGGQVIHKKRTENDEFKFHYTWMTTADYRSRFGHLTYATSGVGTMIFMPSTSGVTEYVDTPAFSTNHGEYRIPIEVAQIGSVELTGIIHSRATQKWVWDRLIKCPSEYHRGWPKETGGDVTRRKIFDLLAEGEESADQRKRFNRELEELLLPERKRLHQLMTDTIYRMIVLIYDEE